MARNDLAQEGQTREESLALQCSRFCSASRVRLSFDAWQSLLMSSRQVVWLSASCSHIIPQSYTIQPIVPAKKIVLMYMYTNYIVQIKWVSDTQYSQYCNPQYEKYIRNLNWYLNYYFRRNVYFVRWKNGKHSQQGKQQSQRMAWSYRWCSRMLLTTNRLVLLYEHNYSWERSLYKIDNNLSHGAKVYFYIPLMYI